MTAVAFGRSRPVRAFRLEVRHSPVLWAIPLLAALFLFDAFRTAAGFVPIWSVRASVITTSMIAEFGPLGAGLAAWVASREGRRNTGDLLETTVRPAWARQAATLAATLFWLLFAFLAGVAVVYAYTARQATWGGPPLWPVVVGVVEVVTLAVIGFTAGALFPGRFTAPLVTIGAFGASLAGFHAALNVLPGSATYALLSPATQVPNGDDGVFYHVPPDLAIAQVMFMGGISVALLGVLVGRSGGRSGGRWPAAAAAALLAAGVAASSTAFALTGTARLGVSGWEIPALHDAASDRPIPYPPDCAGTTLTVCVHPAFSAFLGSAAAALQPVAAEIAGLPGAPVRAEQVDSGPAYRLGVGKVFLGSASPSVLDAVITGTPPVYEYLADADIAPFWGSAAIAGSGDWRAGFQQEFLTAFAGTRGTFVPTPAQQAVITALMVAAGAVNKATLTLHSAQPALAFPQQDDSSGHPVGPSPAQIAAAAVRFGALSPAARHAWLATHLAPLRAGTLTLAQVP
jgi:hypothetical protein